MTSTLPEKLACLPRAASSSLRARPSTMPSSNSIWQLRRLNCVSGAGSSGQLVRASRDSALAASRRRKSPPPVPCGPARPRGESCTPCAPSGLKHQSPSGDGVPGESRGGAQPPGLAGWPGPGSPGADRAERPCRGVCRAVSPKFRPRPCAGERAGEPPGGRSRRRGRGRNSVAASGLSGLGEGRPRTPDGLSSLQSLGASPGSGAPGPSGRWLGV